MTARKETKAAMKERVLRESIANSRSAARATTPLTVRIPASIDAALTGNSRAKWPQKHRLAQELKGTTIWAFRGAINLNDPAPFSHASWPLRFDWTVARGKGKRALDDDNIKSGLKGAIDGIATALEIDDKHFVIGNVVQIRDVEGIGFIEVRIRESEPEETQ